MGRLGVLEVSIGRGCVRDEGWGMVCREVAVSCVVSVTLIACFIMTAGSSN